MSMLVMDTDQEKEKTNQWSTIKFNLISAKMILQDTLVTCACRLWDSYNYYSH